MRTLELRFELARFRLVCVPLTLFVLAGCGPHQKAAAHPMASAAAPLTLAEAGINSAWMDPSANACNDFFTYACGGFVKSATIPADRATWGTNELLIQQTEEFLRSVLEKAAAAPGSDPVLKKVGDYYAACMDESAIDQAGAAPIKPLLAEVARVRDFRSLATAIAELHAATVFPLWAIGSMQDYKNATLMIAGIDQSGLGLPDRDYYLKDEGNMKDVLAFYRGHVRRMLMLAGMKPAQAKRATADVLRIETKIARLQQDKVVRRDPYKVYHPIDRQGLDKLMKGFPWEAYFKTIGFADAQKISVNDPAYYTGIDRLMHEERPAAWRHYLTWQVVRDKAHLLSKPFVDEAFALRQKLSGQKELQPRWKRCVRGVDGALGELLAQPYVAAKFAGDSKVRAQALVQAIRDAMSSELISLPWMDEATRSAALAKLGLIHDKVGYPDKWRVYDFPVSRTAYAANGMAAERFEFHRDINKVGKPVNRAEWGMTPPTVNAYYDQSLNEIVLPAAELQPPFFSPAFYAPVNLGAEGASTIGHELTHAFDDEGSQFDGNGNLRDWWSAATAAKFKQATGCVEDLYSGFDAVPGVKLNGKLTAGENIADIGGVKLGYAALRAWQARNPAKERSVAGFTDAQLYFLGYAQSWCDKATPQYLQTLARTNPHSPPKWRVNGPVSQVPAFAAAFQCKPGQPMSPAKVCSVW